MKKVAFILISIVVVTGMALAIAAWKIGSIVASYKPHIERALSDVIGAEVTVGDIAVSFIPSTTLSVESVSVRSATGGNSDLSVGSIEARAELMPLLSKRIEISSIEIKSPRVTLVRDSAGVSVRGLTAKPAKQAQDTPKVEGARANGDSFKVDIHSIEIHNGALRFEDRVSNTSQVIDKIQLRSSIALEDKVLSLAEGTLSLQALSKHTFELSFNGVSFNQAENALKINAGTLRTPAGELVISGALGISQGPGAIKVTSNSLNIPALLTLATVVQPSLPRDAVTGSLTTNLEVGLQGPNVQKLGGQIGLKAVGYAAPGTPKISGVHGVISVGGSPSDFTVATSGLRLTLENAPLQVSLSSRITPNDVSVSSCKILGFGGEVSLPSTLNLGQKTLRTSPTIRTLSLPQLFAVTAPTLTRTIQGTLTSFDGQFADVLLGNPAPTASGSGSLVVKDGVLKGFNLATQVMSNIDGLPFISGNLRKRVPPEFEKYFSSPDTVITELNAKFAITKGVVQLNELRVAADIFSLVSQGSLGLEGQLNLRATIAFAPDLSNAITNRVLEMKPLLNKEGRLAIPLLVRGKAPAVAVLPDLTDIAQRAAVGTIRETLGGALKGGSGAAKGIGKGLGKVLGF